MVNDPRSIRSHIFHLLHESNFFGSFFCNIFCNDIRRPPSKTFPLVDAETLRQSYYLEQYKSEKFSVSGLRDKIVNGYKNIGKTSFGNEDTIQYDNLSEEDNYSLQQADSLFSPIMKNVEEQVSSLAIQTSNIQHEIINDNILSAHYGKVTDELKKMGERIENTKTFFAGLAGGVASVPFVAFQDIIMKFQFSDAMIHKFYFDTSINSAECAIFALMLRFCVRQGQENNEIFNDTMIIAFTLIRTMSKMSGHGFLDIGLVSANTS